MLNYILPLPSTNTFGSLEYFRTLSVQIGELK